MKAPFRPLATEFTERGFRYRQIKRVDNLALYRVDRKAISGEYHHYEVILVTAHDGFYVDEGKTFIEPAEIYPPAKVWGTRAWTYTTKEDAEKRYDFFKNLLEIEPDRVSFGITRGMTDKQLQKLREAAAKKKEERAAAAIEEAKLKLEEGTKHDKSNPKNKKQKDNPC